MSEDRLPTKEEIAQLPRWARVAFAARCARRAQPNFLKHWPPKEHIDGIENAIAIAEHNAANAYAAAAAYDAAESGVNKKLILADFNHLFALAKKHKWTDETPVPPSVFPPIDTSVKPEIQPVEMPDQEAKTFLLQAFGQPGVTASILAPHLLNVYKALNEYSLAKFGTHISRGKFKRLVLEYAGVPA